MSSGSRSSAFICGVNYPLCPDLSYIFIAMKFLTTQLTFFLSQRQIRQNIRALLKYVLFLIVVIAVYSVLFHFIMLYIEGQRHSWITGIYWTLTVMSTLGFGDITFGSDIGRIFSIVVLLSGIVLLLIMLPFAFIRFFYAPWLEAQIRLQAPREAPVALKDHVIICKYDTIAPGLIRKLSFNRIPYVVLEPDPIKAAQLLGDDVFVVTGEIDSRITYEKVRVDKACLIVANLEDTTNTNITLTVREVNPDVRIVALAEDEDSIDILEMSGATNVLLLKQRLGEHLAYRINAGRTRTHIIGKFKDLLIAEFPVHNTPLASLTVRETRLREMTGVNMVAVWEKGRMLPALADHRLADFDVPVIMGSEQQIAKVDEMLSGDKIYLNPVLIIGGGKVGRAAARALKQKGIPVYIVEQNEALRQRIGDIPDRLVIGDAADRNTLIEAGLLESPAVILTTNDDAINIYLAVYCRRLNPELHIVSRITHERNLEAIHRAGADFVLSYASLGRETIFSILQGRDPVMLGEGVDIFLVRLPESLEGKTIAESDIGAQTGLIIVALRKDGRTFTNPTASTPLIPGTSLLVLGTAEQRQRFSDIYGV
ncbi:MAG TPA: NAD-binding protein [Blastocatellia bacterium]|nr:NAD-binding protein [Blastocatellia bacterium]